MGRFIPISFQDANFEHHFAWVKSEIERTHRRWVPFGMPRLSPAFSHMVFFLYGRNPNSGKIEGPCGTGVLIGTAGSGKRGMLPYLRHVYAVTCWHVAHDAGASIIRINTRDGKSRYIPFEPHEWQFNPMGDDIAAIDVTDKLDAADIFAILPTQLCSTQDFLKEYEFGVGEDGFMLGLFADQAGKEQNLVAARFGNVSLLASDDNPIEQPNHNERPTHIFDMHSRPGFSGSPVFVYRTPAGDIRDITYGPREKPISLITSLSSIKSLTQYYDPHALLTADDIRKNTFIRLLGIHVGEYHDLVEVKKVSTAAQSRGKQIKTQKQTIKEGDKLEIPNSMALVVPAWEIGKLLGLQTFEDQRRARDMRDEKKPKNVAKPTAAKPASLRSVKLAPSTTGDNPQHKEAFTRLVSVAAKKPKQDL